MKKTIEERFWEKVNILGEDDCWEWTKAIHKFGYGKFWLNGKEIHSHRFVYSLIYGNIPDGLWVLHSCDNGRCCNPEHLKLGTQLDNTQDMIDRNRYSAGKEHYTFKFPEKIVRGGGIRII